MAFRRILAVLTFALSVVATAAASVTLTMNVSNVSPSPVPGAYIQATIQNCTNPTILNASTSVPLSRNFYLPANSMQITVTLPDNVSQIACNGNQLSYYTFTLISGATQTVLKSVELPAGVFNLANLANLTAPPFNPGVIQGPIGQPGPAGPAGSAVPLTDANLQANTTAIIGAPTASQSLTQPANTYFNVFGLLATTCIDFGTANTPTAYLCQPFPGTLSLDTNTSGNSAGTFKTGIFNATTGFQIASAAPMNHFLVGNGTSYVDSATLPVGILNYQTAQRAGTTLPQRGIYNFLAPFSANDNSTSGTTEISLAPSGVTAATYTSPSSITFDTFGRATVVTAGSAVNRTCVSAGCYIVQPDGTIIQWGTVASCGGIGCTMSITFPIAFTTNRSITTNCVNQANCATSVSGVTLSGFTFQYASFVLNGGSGGALSGSQTGTWIAVGY